MTIKKRSKMRFLDKTGLSGRFVIHFVAELLKVL